MRKKFLILFSCFWAFIFSIGGLNVALVNSVNYNNRIFFNKQQYLKNKNNDYFKNLDLSKLRFNAKNHNLNLWNYKKIKNNDFLLNYKNIISNKPEGFSIQQDTFIDLSQCLDNYFGYLENNYYGNENIFTKEANDTYYNYNLYFYILKKDPTSQEVLNDPIHSFKWVHFMQNGVFHDFYIRLTNVPNSNWEVNHSYFDFTVTIDSLPIGKYNLTETDLVSGYYNGSTPKDWKIKTFKNNRKENFFIFTKLYSLHFLDISRNLTNKYYLSYFIKNSLFHFSFDASISYPKKVYICSQYNKGNQDSRVYHKKSVKNYELSANNMPIINNYDDQNIAPMIRKIDNLDTTKNAQIKYFIKRKTTAHWWTPFPSVLKTFLFVNSWVNTDDFSLNIAFVLEVTDPGYEAINANKTFVADWYEKLVGVLFKPDSLSFEFNDSGY